MSDKTDHKESELNWEMDSWGRMHRRTATEHEVEEEFFEWRYRADPNNPHFAEWRIAPTLYTEEQAAKVFKKEEQASKTGRSWKEKRINVVFKIVYQ